MAKKQVKSPKSINDIQLFGAINQNNAISFVYADDYYGLEQEVADSLYNYIVFDVSTDEIIARGHSFGYSKRAKQELESDELVIASALVDLSTAILNMGSNVGNLQDYINSSINELKDYVNSSINNFKDYVNDTLLDLSTNILDIIIEDELITAQSLLLLNTSINDLSTNIDNIYNNINELITNINDSEFVILQKFEQVDSSIEALKRINSSLDDLIEQINESEYVIVQKFLELDTSLNTIVNSLDSSLQEFYNDFDNFETVLINYLDKVDTSINLLQVEYGDLSYNLTEFMTNIEERVSALEQNI